MFPIPIISNTAKHDGLRYRFNPIGYSEYKLNSSIVQDSNLYIKGTSGHYGLTWSPSEYSSLGSNVQGIWSCLGMQLIYAGGEYSYTGKTNVFGSNSTTYQWVIVTNKFNAVTVQNHEVIQDIEVMDNNIVLLTKSGNVYCVGYSGSTSSIYGITVPIQTNIRDFFKLSTINIKQIALCGDTLIQLRTDGSLIGSGGGSNNLLDSTMEIIGDGLKVMKLQVQEIINYGRTGIIVLGTDGNYYCRGLNYQGRFGIGNVSVDQGIGWTKMDILQCMTNGVIKDIYMNAFGIYIRNSANELYYAGSNFYCCSKSVHGIGGTSLQFTKLLDVDVKSIYNIDDNRDGVGPYISTYNAIYDYTWQQLDTTPVKL